jgi:hypothetical protein
MYPTKMRVFGRNVKQLFTLYKANVTEKHSNTAQM